MNKYLVTWDCSHSTLYIKANTFANSVDPYETVSSESTLFANLIPNFVGRPNLKQWSSPVSRMEESTLEIQGLKGLTDHKHFTPSYEERLYIRHGGSAHLEYQ